MNTGQEAFFIERASVQARLLAASGAFSLDEVADARQDLLLDFLWRAPKFDSSRGTFEGFVYGVMKNRAAVLVVRRRRRTGHEPSTEDVWHGSTGKPSDSIDSLEARHQRDVEPGLIASIGVQRVLDGLPPQLLKLALLLSEMPVLEACVQMGRSRSCVFRLTRQIEDAFVRAGFRPNPRRRPSLKVNSGTEETNGRF